MAEPSKSKENEDISTVQENENVDGGRRGTLASLNLNKNLDAKYVGEMLEKQYRGIIDMFLGSQILSRIFREKC
jgi:hypothetical protein